MTTQDEKRAPSLAAAMFPDLPRDDNAKPKLVLQQERRAAERAAADRASLLRNLRAVNNSPRKS